MIHLQRWPGSGCSSKPKSQEKTSRARFYVRQGVGKQSAACMLQVRGTNNSGAEPRKKAAVPSFSASATPREQGNLGGGFQGLENIG